MRARHPFHVAERLERCRTFSSIIDLIFYAHLTEFRAVLIRIVLILSLLSASCASSAKTVTIEKYLEDEIAFMNFHVSWLDGVFNGLKWANFELERNKKPLLFCAPPNFSMTSQEVNAFFAKFIASHKDKVSKTDPIGTLLLEALQEAYPCPR